MVTTANALLKSQALDRMAQVVKPHRCIGGAAEEASERLLSSHNDILHGMRQPWQPANLPYEIGPASVDFATMHG